MELVLAVALYGSLVLLSIALTVALYNAYTAPRLRCPPPNDAGPARPRVSLLVPVRDEAANLERHLKSWTAALGRGDELLVLDDQSRDDSARIARAGGAEVIEGRPKPAGWFGKSWACHQLAARASGDIFIFVDADVLVHPRAVHDTASWIASGATDALSAMSRQTYSGLVDRAVVPFVMHLPIWCTLPLTLVLRVPQPSACAANGLWMAFTRESYFAIDGHRAVRNVITEDVALARLIKSAGLRFVFTIAPDRLATRMYGSWAELRDGFARSMFALCGGRAGAAAAILSAHLVVNLAPLLVFVRPGFPAWAGLILLVIVRATVARQTGGGALDILLHPFGALIAAYVFVRSWIGHRSKSLVWRDRGL